MMKCHLVDETLLHKIAKEPLRYALYFEDSGFLKPHYYLIIPTKNQDEFILLTMITSQIDKVTARLDDKDLECLVYLDESNLELLYKSSVIDCNYPRRAKFDEILKLDKLRAIEVEIDRELIIEIVGKINKSRFPTLRVKKSIDLSIL